MTMRVQTQNTNPPALEAGMRAPRHAARLQCAALCAVLAAAAVLLGLPQTGARRLPAAAPPPAAPALDSLLLRAESAEAAGRNAEALALHERIAAAYTHDPLAEPAHVRCIQARLAAGDVDAARDALRAFRAAYAGSQFAPDLLIDLAALQFERGRYAEAAGSYTEIVAQVTSASLPAAGGEDAAAPVLFRSKRLWMEHKRRERDRTQLERLARFNQALAYERAGSHAMALRAYDRFLARYPQDERVAEARFRMAVLLYDAGHAEAALRHFSAVYAAGDADVALRSESIYRAGAIHLALRRHQAAATTWRLALELRPANDGFRLASLADLARQLETRQPLRALALYREIAESATQPAWRAAAQERLLHLERDSALVAAAGS